MSNIIKGKFGGIIIFITLVMVLTFISPFLGGSPSAPGPGFVLWGTAPLLVAVVMRIVSRDWSDSGFKPAIRKNALWYIVSISAFPIMTILTYIFGEVISVSSFSSFSILPFLKTFLTALPVFFIFAIFEEVGWRGYLVPKLAASGVNSYLAYAIVSVTWATWHMPYFRELSWVYSSESIIGFIPRFYLAMFVFTILYYEVRIITQSVWPAVLMHCFMNAFGHPLAADYLRINPGMEYLVSSTGVFMIVFTGALGLGLHIWRIKKNLIMHTSN